jgi:hypothetical protein
MLDIIALVELLLLLSLMLELVISQLQDHLSLQSASLEHMLMLE